MSEHGARAGALPPFENHKGWGNLSEVGERWANPGLSAARLDLDPISRKICEKWGTQVHPDPVVTDRITN
ncbi:MAG: hypothetical protein JWN74_27 [Acidobacteriaceae bacterium]|nr:hypothetical protein [Acidobacteriaceae bacterium]